MFALGQRWLSESLARRGLPGDKRRTGGKSSTVLEMKRSPDWAGSYPVSDDPDIKRIGIARGPDAGGVIASVALHFRVLPRLNLTQGRSRECTWNELTTWDTGNNIILSRVFEDTFSATCGFKEWRYGIARRQGQST